MEMLFLQKNDIDKNIVRRLSNIDGDIKIKTYIEEFDKNEFLKNAKDKLEISKIEICNTLEESDKKIFHYLKENNQHYIHITSVYIDKINKQSIISGLQHKGYGKFEEFSCSLNSLDIDIEDVKSIINAVCNDIFVSTFGFRFFHDSERFTAKEFSEEYNQHLIQQNIKEMEEEFNQQVLYHKQKEIEEFNKLKELKNKEMQMEKQMEIEIELQMKKSLEDIDMQINDFNDRKNKNIHNKIN